MPLIIITGLPCSGKSHRARQIAEYLSGRIADEPWSSKRTVVTVPSHHAGLDASSSVDKPTTLRDQVYNSAAREKTARAEEFSAAKRALSKDCIVVADSLNYIKGYRYQLWCEAKAAATRSCVVHVAAPESQCREWNEQRLRAWAREGEIEGAQAGADAASQAANGEGHLVPESHTTLYGDRDALQHDRRSRSSSLDGNDAPSATLASLSLSGRAAQEGVRGSSPLDNATQPPAESSWLPSALVPSPSSAPPYGRSTLTSVIMRYEPPSPFTRWDTPLFTVPSTDSHPPYAAIWDALYPPPAKATSKRALAQQAAAVRSGNEPGHERNNNQNKVEEVRRHQATILPTATSSDALQTLESTTLLVVQTLLKQAREQGIAEGDGGSITLSLSLPAKSAASADGADQIIDTDELTIPAGTVLSQPMLQRLRRKYTQMQRTSISHGQGYAGQTDGRRGVVDGFMQFLRLEFGDD